MCMIGVGLLLEEWTLPIIGEVSPQLSNLLGVAQIG